MKAISVKITKIVMKFLFYLNIHHICKIMLDKIFQSGLHFLCVCFIISMPILDVYSCISVFVCLFQWCSVWLRMSWEHQVEPVACDKVSIVVVGDPLVGKSAIIQQFCDGIFTHEYVSTVGADLNSRVMQVDGKFVRVQLWDTSGQEGFMWAAKNHIAEADGLVFVYDVTNNDSLTSLVHWHKDVQKYASRSNLPKILIGNKTDLRHKQMVGASTAKEFGIPEGMTHVEVSARTNRYINVAFFVLTSDILRYRQLGTIVPIGIRSDFTIAAQEAHEADSAMIYAESMEDGPDYTHLFKILVVGAPRVGKTCLRYRFCKDYYTCEYTATAGFDYSTRTLLIDGAKVKLQIWDVAGDDVFQTTRQSYYKGANAFLIVYDVTNMDSFTKAEHLLKELDMSGCDDQPKILVGNKVDTKRKKTVDFSTAKDFGDGWRVPVLEVSARYGTNVDTAFTRLAFALKRQLAPWKKLYNF